MNIFRVFSFVFLIISVITGQSDSNKKLVVHFFGSETCGECLTVRTKLLKPLIETFPDRLNVKIHDIEKENDFQLLVKMEEEYKVLESSSETLFLPDTFLTGFDDIMKSGRTFIEDRLKNPSLWTSQEIEIDSSEYSQVLKKKFSKFSFISILLAGLADGVNPCAIATMIFLISFLATQKRKRSEILIIGLAFTFTVFLTYLLMGIGAFKALTFLSKYLWISQTIKWIAVVFAGTVGLICFKDAIVYKKTKKTKDITLQLPKAVKMKIHKVIKGQLSQSSLITGAVATGFLVTLLEAVCTGQVYLPTIVLMTREEGLRLTGWLYLIFYNILFVLPLLIIMVMAYFGLTWDRLAKATQSNLSILKILLGIVLILLAVFLAFAL